MITINLNSIDLNPIDPNMTFSAANFTTHPFFNLQDKWIATATGEVTHYFDMGSGTDTPPVLLLHGSGMGTSAALTWWLNLPQLGQSNRSIAFDLIGYGETVCAPDTQFGIKAWGAHAMRVLDALNIDKAWLVGSSLGGWVALQLALDYPKRIYGVVSIGTGGAQRDTTTPSSPHYPAKPKPALSKALIKKDLRKNIGHDALICDTLVDIRYQAAIKEAANGLRPLLLAARNYDREQLPLAAAVLQNLLKPVLLVHGVEDKVVPLSRSLDLLSAIPHADAHIYSGCGHWPHIGKAEAFNHLVSHFIASHSAHSS